MSGYCVYGTCGQRDQTGLTHPCPPRRSSGLQLAGERQAKTGAAVAAATEGLEQMAERGLVQAAAGIGNLDHHTVAGRHGADMHGAARRHGLTGVARQVVQDAIELVGVGLQIQRSEEHTSELQSLMRISYAVFCLKKKKKTKTQNIHTEDN